MITNALVVLGVLSLLSEISWFVMRYTLKWRQERTWEPFNGSFFIQPLTVLWKTWPLTWSHSWETDGEFRFSPRTLVWHMWPFGIGFAFGWWRPTPVRSLDEEEAIPSEEDVAYASYVAVNGDVPRETYDRVRALVAAQGFDPDEEMELMQMLGAMG